MHKTSSSIHVAYLEMANTSTTSNECFRVHFVFDTLSSVYVGALYVKASFGFVEEDWNYVVCLIVVFMNIYNLNSAASSKMNSVEVDGCEEDEDNAKESDSHVFGSNGI